MGSIKGIVFDMDGTLLDSSSVLIAAWYSALSKFSDSVQMADVSKAVKESTPSDTLVRMFIQDAGPETISEVKKLRANAAADRLSPSLLFDGVTNTLRSLRISGIKLAIATGMSHDLLDIVIKSTGLEKLVDVVISSDDVIHGKPAPDVALEAFRRIGVDPKEGMVVGDSENDVLSGKAAHAATALVSANKEIKTSADFIIGEVRDIFSIIT
ncbi:MAG: HAD family hydrolase [Candidatus Parvarchaeum sp.]